jgi:hypothetical protein
MRSRPRRLLIKIFPKSREDIADILRPAQGVHSRAVQEASQKNNNRSAMGNGTNLQCKALKGRGKRRRRKSNEKQWRKAIETMKSADVMQPKDEQPGRAHLAATKNPPTSSGGRQLAQIRD